MAGESKGFKEFNKAMTRFAKTLMPAEVSLVQKKVSFEALSRFVKRTPVDTGRARGGWQASIGTPKKYEIVARDKDGSSTIQRESRNISVIPPYSVVYITNNVSYIEVLDEGLFDPKDPGPSKDPRPDRSGRTLVSGGFSTQSVEGIVNVTLQELRLMFP